MNSQLKSYGKNSLCLSTKSVHISLKKDNKKLSLGGEKIERHPSASKLLEQASRIEVTEETTLAGSTILSMPSSAPTPTNITIVLSTCPNPLYDKNDILYIKTEGNQSGIEGYNLTSAKPEKFPFSPEQIKIDKDITECIQKGEDFSVISEKFDGMLKDNCS